MEIFGYDLLENSPQEGDTLLQNAFTLNAVKPSVLVVYIINA